MKQNIKEGDYFVLSKDKGYSDSQRKKVMQVLELWDNCMTVICEGGCMSKPYDHFEKVEVVHASYFEDNRTSNIK